MTDTPSFDLLPMRDVVSLTGINPVTLRAWERRHGLISPQRTEGGHRLYTARDVQRIRDILRWTGNGVPISKVGGLLAGQPEAPPRRMMPFTIGAWPLSGPPRRSTRRRWKVFMDSCSRCYPRPR